MKESGATYDPTLSVWEGQAQLAAGQADLLDRSLVQQAVAPALLTSTRAFVRGGTAADASRAAGLQRLLQVENGNLKRAYEAGVTLVTGSDAGNPLVLHGPDRATRASALGRRRHSRCRGAPGRDVQRGPSPPRRLAHRSRRQGP